jgi:type IV secretory pathway VirB2 component (pilin)
MLFDSTVQNSTTGNVSPWKMLALGLTSLLLFCGAFSPIASVFAIILAAICWPVWGGLRSFEFALQTVVMIALLLLGPGAYSIDSKMFGRRLILPPE